MRNTFAVLLLVLATAARATAGEVVLEFRDGFVTLTARDAPVRQILEEWSRLGNTRVVNADKVFGGPVTLELARVPEKQALEIVLRTAAGYIAAPRGDAGGPSQFARILVMPPSAAPPPRQPSMRPAVVRPPIFQQPTYSPPVLLDDQDQPVDPNMPGPQGIQGNPNVPEDGMQGTDPAAMPQPGPYPGVQPYAPAGDPPPQSPEQEGDGVPQQPQATPPGPLPVQGNAVAPRPGQVVTPNPNQQPKR